MSDSSVQAIDCSVHPSVRQSDDLREYMREPWRSRPFPGPERYFYPAPIKEYRADAGITGALPGSAPDRLEKYLFTEGGVEYAVLLPLTRGILTDADLAAAVCSATNDWLADTWLKKYNQHGRFRGSIRVSPLDPAQAVDEIERWAGHPHMVQVAVPMQAHHPYGQRVYFPIWEAAARHDLPVAIHADGGSSVDFWPSPVGYYRHFIEYRTLYATNFAYHLTSLIAEGVFDRLERARFVFADGACLLLPPLAWRIDKNWRPTRRDTPWVKHLPTSYLRDHVRFCADRFDGPSDPEMLAEWLEISDAWHLLLFASNYPYWDFCNPREAFDGTTEELRRRIMFENAREFYKLPAFDP